jgi:hypothetical protein
VVYCQTKIGVPQGFMFNGIHIWVRIDWCAGCGCAFCELAGADAAAVSILQRMKPWCTVITMVINEPLVRPRQLYSLDGLRVVISLEKQRSPL